MSLLNGDLFDDPDPESENRIGWVRDEPWPGFDRAALDAEWCDGESLMRTPGWVDEVIDRILGEGDA